MSAMDELMKAFQASADAQFELNKAHEEYDGYSWDYHGYHFIEAKENANRRFQEALQGVIDERVALAIANLNKGSQ